MKNLVVDSGISVKWFIEEDDSDIAQLIYDEYESGNLLFLAPDLIYAEFGNIIWKKQIFKNLDPIEANFAIQKFKKISFTLTPITALFDEAFQISVKYNRTFYDSLYFVVCKLSFVGFCLSVQSPNFSLPNRRASPAVSAPRLAGATN